MSRMSDAKHLSHTLDLCLRVGEMLLSSGAGAADVTATMRSVAYALGVRNPQVDVTFTSLSMTVQESQDDVPLVQIRSVHQREIDYEDLTRVDHMVRDLVAGRKDLQEARAHHAPPQRRGPARASRCSWAGPRRCSRWRSSPRWRSTGCST